MEIVYLSFGARGAGLQARKKPIHMYVDGVQTFFYKRAVQ